MPKEIEKSNNTATAQEIEDKELEEIIREVKIHSAYSGPIPPPDMMMQYKRVDKSFPDRLLKMTEESLEHTKKIQNITAYTESISTILGIVCATSISFFTIYKGSEIIMAGHSVSGSILAGIGLTSLVGTFIYGTRGKNNKS